MTASDRARWLPELSEALEKAQTLIGRLGADIETLDLSARVETARAEVRSLRLNRLDGKATDFAPHWTNPPWDARAEQT